MATEAFPKIGEPRFVDGKPLLIAGLAERFGVDAGQGIPRLWEAFRPHIGTLPGEIGGAAYGVVLPIFGGGEGFQYLAGVEVGSLADLPKTLTSVHLPAQRYAVFVHRGPAAAIPDTMQAIMGSWLPNSGHTAGETPTLIERYGEGFNPATGEGEIEIWIPLKS